jgi:LysR family glycine cleavage system transcriptional activator
MSRRLPPLGALRAFEAAARHLSFTKAGDELHVTQAAVSHQVRTLEDWLGLKLFRRHGRAVLLTEAGQTYLPGVRDALDGLAAATSGLLARESSGVLTVSVLASFAANWLVRRLGRFRALYPDIDVRLTASDELTDFAREDVHLAIRYGNGNWPGLEVLPLLTEDIFPVCSPALLQGPHPLKVPADLKYHTLLQDDMRENWRLWMMAAGVEGVDPERGPGFNLSVLVVDAALLGQGVALARSALVDHHLRAGRLVRPFDIKLPANFAYYVVYPPAYRDLPKLRAFVDWMMDEAAREESDADVIAAGAAAATN